MTETPLDQALADAVLELARERLPAAMQGVVAMVMDIVPSADAAAVMLWDRAASDASIATDETVRELVDRHLRNGATPVLEACERREPVYSGDLRRELRWREFSHDMSRSLGINSLLAVPVTVQDLPRGVLAIFAEGLDAFDAEDQEAAQVAALHATAAVAVWLERRSLGREVSTRRIE